MAIKLKFLWIIAWSSLLAGCHTTSKTPSIPEQGLTVQQIYHQATKEVKPLPRKVTTSAVVSKPAPSEFKPLPNPSIDLYVFPHVMQLGDEQLIKPGYTTAFYLYKTNPYALATELYS